MGLNCLPYTAELRGGCLLWDLLRTPQTDNSKRALGFLKTFYNFLEKKEKKKQGKSLREILHEKAGQRPSLSSFTGEDNQV